MLIVGSCSPNRRIDETTNFPSPLQIYQESLTSLALLQVSKIEEEMCAMYCIAWLSKHTFSSPFSLVNLVGH